MIESILRAFFGALVDGVLGFFAQKRRDGQLEELGWHKGAEATGAIIAEISDAQREIDGRDRGGAGDVARRLRDRLAKPPGSDGKP